jgi:hypothetical protein
MSEFRAATKETLVEVGGRGRVKLKKERRGEKGVRSKDAWRE